MSNLDQTPWEFKCSVCGKGMNFIEEIGYMGAKDRTSDECNPHTEMETLCRECEEKRHKQ